MIRKAVIDDIPAMMRMAFKFHKAAKARRFAAFEDSLETWQEWLRVCIFSDQHLCLIAEKDGKPEGFITGAIVPAYWNRNVRTAHECTLWVEEDARAAGVGSALLESLVAWGTKMGVTIVSSGSTVYMRPKEMGVFLRKHGFSLEERIYSKRVE